MQCPSPWIYHSDKILLLCFFRLEITVFSRIFRIPKIPVARRSSVRSAKPFLMDSLALRFLTSLPSSLITPSFLVATPKIFSSVSVPAAAVQSGQTYDLTLSSLQRIHPAAKRNISRLSVLPPMPLHRACWSWAGTGWSVHGLPSS